MKNTLYNTLLIQKKSDRKLLGVLLDPDHFVDDELLHHLCEHPPDWLLVGGSLLHSQKFHSFIQSLRHTGPACPLVLFPGDRTQIDPKADAILLLSLISGRNPELLIGQHVLSAKALKASGLELMPTGYMLIESGAYTTAHYMSNCMPIPRQKPEVAASTALAGEQLGLKLVYLDGGSGASLPVPPAMIRQTAQALEIPLIVGGGLDTTEKLAAAYQAGADMAIVGTALEKKPQLYNEFREIALNYR